MFVRRLLNDVPHRLLLILLLFAVALIALATGYRFLAAEPVRTTNKMDVSRALAVRNTSPNMCSEDDPCDISAPWVGLSPWSGTFSSASLQVTIDYSDDATGGPGYYASGIDSWASWIELNGLDVTSNFPGLFSWGGVSGHGTGTISLSPSGANEFAVYVCDVAGNCRTEITTYTYSPPVAVTPDAEPMPVGPANGLTYYFAVRNPRSTARQFAFTITCTGAATCGATPASATIGQTSTATIAVPFNVAGSLGVTGAVTLRATDVADGSNTDTGTLNVVIRPAGPVVARGACLTIAAGADAAYECGDLRIVHGLPAVRTLNTVRSPTLLYNSQHAHPYPIVVANATLPVGVSTPDSVVTTVVLNGQTYSRSVPGSQFLPAGSSRRAMVALDAANLATSSYDYTLEVRSYTGVGSAVLTSSTSALPIVNRSTSAFGSGWWIAGLEELRFLSSNRVLWVGGDGSAKTYEQVGTTSTHGVYMAPALAYPDTLLKELSTGLWTRRIPSGGWIGFDATGKHTSTNNRLGFATTFQYNGDGLLWRINIPPATAGLTYEFAYTGTGASSKLANVTVPDSAPATVRTTQVAIDAAGRVQSITDPGVAAVTFEYDPTITQRITSRSDRRRGVTRFRYDAAHRLASSTVPLSATDSSHLTFCAGESAGLTSCQPILALSSEVRTFFDGPRYPSDVADTTAFWLDRFGSPSRIRNAYGFETVVQRSDVRFPVLATRMRTADGHVIGARYDHRGNLLESTDSSHATVSYGITTYAKTAYEWDAVWNLPTKVTSPLGVITRRQYDPYSGNTSWQEDGRGLSSRTEFSYYANKLLRAAIKPGGAYDSLAYEPQRLNVSATVTPMGKRTLFVTDRLGRVIVTRAVLNNSTELSQNDTVKYDRLDRVIRKVSYGPPIDSVLAQRLVVDKDYDDEGNLRSLTRTMTPNVSMLPLTTTWVYDTASRRVAEIAPDLKRDSTVYDPAGNSVKSITRRGAQIQFEYDALNRMLRKTVPAASDTAWRDGVAMNDTTAVLNPAYGGVAFPVETVEFAYDEVGRLIRASNPDARIRRTYTAFGALETDSLWIASWARDSEHPYGMRYEYDLDGRTQYLYYPAQLVGGTSGRAIYLYDGTTGFLSQVNNLQGQDFILSYNSRSELEQVTMPGNIIELNTYDNDGLLQVHRIQNATPTNLPDRFAGAWIEQSSLTYDNRGKLLTATNTAGLQDSRTVIYSGLGQVFKNTYFASGVNTSGFPLSATVSERFSHDPMGNIHSGQETYTVSVNSGPGLWAFAGFQSNTVPRLAVFDDTTGRITKQTQFIAGGSTTQRFRYDAQGNATFATTRTAFNDSANNNRVVIEDRASYYDAAGMLRVADYRKSEKPHGWSWYDASLIRVLETYRYDPLGRRILVRADKDCRFSSAKPACDISTLRRTVWSGDQELVEIQRPVAGMRMIAPDNITVAMMESDTTTLVLPPRTTAFNYSRFIDIGQQYGRVAYTHALGIDRPLSVTRLGYVDHYVVNGVASPAIWPTFTVVPHWNVRGEAATGTFASGAARYKAVLNGVQREVAVDWPLGALAFNRLVGDTLSSWQGSLIQQKLDAVGTLYRRNRYYDPATGRFTQEDPIGLAGGMNLYGFASGDPVNHSDPFGLCTPQPWCRLLAVAGGGAISGAATELPGAAAVASALAPTASWAALSLVGGVLLRPAFPGAGKSLGRGQGTWASEATGTTGAPELPEDFTGENVRPGSGNRSVSDSKEDPQELFDRLTGGQSQTDAKGQKVGPNGVRLRPGTETKGPRIDIPARPPRPHETIHFPPGSE